MKRLVSGGQWVSKRLKACPVLRYGGSALRPDRPSGPGDATRQEADHPSGAGPSLIRVVDQGTSEDIGAVRRAVPTISGPVCASVEGDSARSPRLGHAFFGPEDSHNRCGYAAHTLKVFGQGPTYGPI